MSSRRDSGEWVGAAAVAAAQAVQAYAAAYGPVPVRAGRVIAVTGALVDVGDVAAGVARQLAALLAAHPPAFRFYVLPAGRAPDHGTKIIRLGSRA